MHRESYFPVVVFVLSVLNIKFEIFVATEKFGS